MNKSYLLEVSLTLAFALSAWSAIWRIMIRTAIQSKLQLMITERRIALTESVASADRAQLLVMRNYENLQRNLHKINLLTLASFENTLKKNPQLCADIDRDIAEIKSAGDRHAMDLREQSMIVSMAVLSNSPFLFAVIIIAVSLSAISGAIRSKMEHLLMAEEAMARNDAYCHA